MKKVLSIILIMILFLTVFCGCVSKNSVVGVWKVKGKESHMYIYKNGTGDIYSNGSHHDTYNWEIDGDEVVFSVSGILGGTYKYSIKGNTMYDAQEKVAMTKESDDTKLDID